MTINRYFLWFLALSWAKILQFSRKCKGFWSQKIWVPVLIAIHETLDKSLLIFLNLFFPYENMRCWRTTRIKWEYICELYFLSFNKVLSKYWLGQSLCVDHNKLWKILKEMRIPDHLTCLLRNLYAAQEANS